MPAEVGARFARPFACEAPSGPGRVAAVRDPPIAHGVSVDDGDNDPVALLSHIAVAADPLFPLTPELSAILASPGPFEPSAIQRVCSGLSTLPEHVLILDDVQLV